MPDTKTNAKPGVSRSASLSAISEAEACSWLGRRVSLLVYEDVPATTGRVQHVSSRKVFLLLDDRTVESRGGAIRSIPLASIERIVSAVPEESRT